MLAPLLPIGSSPTKGPNMKNNIILAVIPGVVVSAALLLSFRPPVTAESIVGYLSVLALVGVAAMEYGFNWKRTLGR